jgi:hypothetical protein
MRYDCILQSDGTYYNGKHFNNELFSIKTLILTLYNVSYLLKCLLPLQLEFNPNPIQCVLPSKVSTSSSVGV